MNKTNLISLILIIISFLLFLNAYYYHQQVYRHKLGYAKTISTITSTFRFSKKLPQTTMASSGYVITEGRSILITMLASILLLVLSCIFVFTSRIKHGKDNNHLRLVFTALLISVCILYTMKLTGLFYYA